MRCLLSGSTSASASGCRAKVRLNRVSSVGEVIDWFTGSTSVASLRSDQVMPRRVASLGGSLGRLLGRLLGGSLGLYAGLLPPGFRQVARQRSSRRPFYP